LTIKVKDIIDEVFQDYKETSMFIAISKCDWKCCNELGLDKSICQNSEIAMQKTFEVPVDEIFSRYTQNNITKSIVIGGLEPFLQFDEVLNLIKYFRTNNVNDEFIIYTGYYKKEIQQQINTLTQFKNLIVKFGRFIPDQKSHYDNILGVNLISNNQYAERIS
jgi:hypothetical protein